MGRYRLLGLFLTLAFVWGASFVATKAALAYVPPVTLAAVRFDLSALLLFGYAALTTAREDWLPRRRADWYVVGVGGLLTVGAHNALLFAGQQYVASAVAAVLLGLIPVITPVLARVFAPTERLGAVAALGVLVCFVGVVVIADPTPESLAESGLVGVAFVAASALVFALGAVLLSGTDPTVPLVPRQAWTMLVGALGLHLATVAFPGQPFFPPRLPGEALFALAYLAVVAGAGGFLLYFYLLETIGPVEVGFVEYVTPLSAALVGWLWLDEGLAATTVVGFVCILAGFLLVKREAIRAELRRVRG
jgi:drug/metabolite transporter (DMT)-like permease